MGKKLLRFQNATLVFGAATVSLLCVPCLTHAQSSNQQAQPMTEQAQPSTQQDRQAMPSDDITRRDLARFDQFLDSHREIAEQLRKTPSLVDDPQFLQSHPVLNTYLQDHPSVKQEISERPDTFMRLEDQYAHDRNMRDRDAGGQDRDADRRDVANRDNDRRDMDNRDNDRRDVASFDRFLDEHREIAEQVRKDPSLLDNRTFVQNHPALQTYLQDNPGVRDQIRQAPTAFMRQEDAYDRDTNMRDRDPMHDHMADFGGFLHSHSDIQKDLSRNPSFVKDHDYVQNHTELEAYLNAHPDVRAELMANPQSFVHGAQQYGTASGSGSSAGAGAGVTGRGTGTTGSTTGTPGSMTGTSTNPVTTQKPPKQ
jgi:hypothetical protein